MVDHANGERMAEAAEEIIRFAVGPFEVTRETGPAIASQVTFRHFRPMEVLLAREFVRRAVIDGTYYFDVYLLTAEAEDFIRREGEAFWRLAIPYMHRIDGACMEPGGWWLFEFKPRLKYSAIGQLAAYRDWFIRQYQPDRPVRLMVVYALERPELWETCERLEIKRCRLEAERTYVS